MKFRCLSDIVRVGDACAAADVGLRVHATALVRGTRHLSSLPAMPSPPLPTRSTAERASAQQVSVGLRLAGVYTAGLQPCTAAAVCGGRYPAIIGQVSATWCVWAFHARLLPPECACVSCMLLLAWRPRLGKIPAFTLFFYFLCL